MTTFSISASGHATETPLGTPWEVLGPSGVNANGTVFTGAGTNPSMSGYLNSVTNFGDDQYCEITWSGTLVAADNVGVGARGQNGGSGFTGYIASNHAGDGRTYVLKYVNGTPTTIANPTATFANPLRVSVTTSGANALIAVTNNGTHITGSPFTDSTSPIAGGQPTIYYDRDNIGANGITLVAGGDVGGSVSAKLLSMINNQAGF